MWQVVIIYQNEEIELDTIYNIREEAEKRAISATQYFSMFGGFAAIFPYKIAQEVKKAKSNINFD